MVECRRQRPQVQIVLSKRLFISSYTYGRLRNQDARKRERARASEREKERARAREGVAR